MPPRIPSGTTITNANTASFSERPSALVRIGPIGAWYWVDVPGEVGDPVPVLGQQRLVDAELVIERADRARRRQRAQDRAPRVARAGPGRATNTITLSSHSVISARPSRLRMNLVIARRRAPAHALLYACVEVQLRDRGRVQAADGGRRGGQAVDPVRDHDRRLVQQQRLDLAGDLLLRRADRARRRTA